MKFTVISRSLSGYLILESLEKKPIGSKVPVFLNGVKVAEVFDTIGRVDSPLYLARPLGSGEELIGKEVDNKNI